MSVISEAYKLFATPKLKSLHFIILTDFYESKICEHFYTQGIQYGC